MQIGLLGCHHRHLKPDSAVDTCGFLQVYMQIIVLFQQEEHNFSMYTFYSKLYLDKPLSFFLPFPFFRASPLNI
jgi:hypothetical protein